MAIGSGDWDDGLLDLFGVPRSILPAICDSAGPLGMTDPDLFGAPIAITGMAGDQQAALIGQSCLEPGQTKATFARNRGLAIGWRAALCAGGFGVRRRITDSVAAR